MSRIKSEHTKPELQIRKFLFSKGLRFRLHDKKLPGKPDIVLSKYKTVIFIHGCFWHGHKGCKYYVVPKTRTDWWLNKINTNKLNDNNSLVLLKKNGWHVVTIWECELKNKDYTKRLQNLISELEAQIKGKV
jgi:DNA mismatch endonuclease (patch repair protein)